MNCPFLKSGGYCTHSSVKWSKEDRCKHETRCPLIEESETLTADAYKNEKERLESLETTVEAKSE
jgi:hypothetical protein